MCYDLPSQATIYRRLLELEEQVEKLNNEIEKIKRSNENHENN